MTQLSFTLLDFCPDILPPTGTVVGTILPVVNSYAQGLHVLLANVFESQVGAAHWPGASGKLSIQLVLGNPPICHVVEMAKPSKTPLAQRGVETGHLSLFEDFLICHTILPSDVEDVSEVTDVIYLETSFFS